MVTYAEPLTCSGAGQVCDNGSKHVSGQTTDQSDQWKTRVIAYRILTGSDLHIHILEVSCCFSRPFMCALWSKT